MSNKKITSLPLIVAGLLLIMIRVATTGVTVPPANNIGYLSYTFLKSFSNLGMSLIPLYFGFHAEYFQAKNTLSKISKFSLIYLITSVLTVIIGFLAFDSHTLTYFWSFLFPISQNLYPYATAITIIFLFLPALIKWLNSLSTNNLKILLYSTTLLLVIAPTLFGKDSWGNGTARLLLFNLYLVVLGYSANKLKLINHQHKLLKFLISLLVFVGLIILMFYVSPSLHGNYSTINRFTMIQSFFSVILALHLFDLLDNKVSMSITTMTTFLIVTIITAGQPAGVLNLDHMLDKILRPNWLLDYLQDFTVILVTITILTIGLLLLQNTKWFQRMEQKLTFSTPTEFINKLSDFKAWLIANKRILYVMLSFYVITLIQMEAVARASHGSIFELFIHFHSAIFLTTIITTAFFLLVYFLTNRFWYAYGLVFVIELLLTISTFLKIQLRAEPVLPTDMSALKSASDILDMISPIIVIVGIITIILLATITVILQLRYQKNYQLKLKWKQRVIYIVLLTISLSGLLFVNHQNTIPSRVFDLFHIQKKFFNQENGARINGPLLQFVNNMDVSVMSKPEGYTKKNIEKIMHKYDDEAATINASRNDWAKNQTVIFALSESFSDPRRVPNLKVAGNPIPNITTAEAQNSSGLMMSSGYGGGTANMEWQSLTGLDLSSLSPTLPTPYSQLVTHLDENPNITNLFDEKIAVHPYNASLYNRKDVFKDFGFQKFYYQGSKYKLKYTDKVPASPYISDESAYKEVEDLISKDNNKSQFIQLSTMQNHLPFDNSDTKEAMKVSGSAMGKNEKSVENYVERIRYTDKAVKTFLEKLDTIDRPITLVWYGDHLPGIYAGDSMSKYAVPLHQTDYFIFNNKAARNKVKFNKLVSPYSFSALALQQANVKVTPYYALITKVTTDVPASINDPHTTVKNTYNGAQIFITKDGKTIKPNELTRNQQETLKDYKLIQYDIVAGKQYSAKWAERKNLR